MKTYYLLAIVMTVLGLSSCGGGNETPSVDNEDAPKIDLEMKTVKYENGQVEEEFQVKKGTEEKHGTYKLYGENGKLLSEKIYKNNMENGIAKDYYETGNVQQEIVFVDGKYEGEFTAYHPDGKTVAQKGVFKNNVFEGSLKTYYADGTLKSDVVFVDGMTSGPFKEYYPNGKLSYEGTFTSVGEEDEKENGELKEYDEAGELIRRAMCLKGVCCTVWTKENGDAEPSSPLCADIIAGKDPMAAATEPTEDTNTEEEDVNNKK
ncbi:MAG: toxin-antitoxin system YwqK family antitoxin [Saprospiraceae bacterium]|nr:toxin-antitoxin system YwqK family antitoxin [Saprospiraceae bacterium]